jgi:hypothetical protein
MNELIQALIALVPVVFGGVIAISGGLIVHLLSTADEKKVRKAEKYEELMAAIWDHKHWMKQMESHRVFGTEAPVKESPIGKILAITALYFPKLKEKVIALDLAADRYEIWMLETGKKRLQNGLPSSDSLEKGTEIYKPYMEAWHDLIKTLELGAAEI